MVREQPFRIRNQELVSRYKVCRYSQLTNAGNTDFEKVYKNALKRNKRRVKEFETGIDLAKQYKQHRSNVLGIISNQDNVDSMFVNDSSSRCNVQTYDEMCSKLESNQRGLIYNDVEIRNIMMLISTMLIETVLIELKLRNIQLEDAEKGHEIAKFIEDFKTSDAFFSLQRFRANFYHCKSSQYLNYWDSDACSQTKSIIPIVFLSPYYDDTEILEKLDKAFKEYHHHHHHHNSNTTEKLAHINLAYQIVQIFLSRHSYIPTIKTWSFLLDKLCENNLTNYQQIVYLSLLQYKHQPSVLATPSEPLKTIIAPLIPDHFLHLIQQDPEILSSLLAYQVPRNDKEMFVELLSFLKLDEVAREVLTIKSPLLSRSKYKLPKIIPGYDFDITNLTITRSCIYRIMKLTISIGLFEYLDLLFDKIVLHSKDQENILLSYTENSLVKGKIFDCDLFMVMLDAAEKSNDMGRVMWILPFLDEFIAENHQQIPKHLREKVLETLAYFELEGKLQTYKALIY
ncbi:hypothetical protein KGF56_004025 [Candida oxycetoniae]|uniref:Uncharacterized protein n=1 Tax=Candida oxycetoniae TaxID=497107 RepID=A0AAI9SU57_9ASCO|nr:uncharacterized protein KGF56_004025 [Candida oxycetoniae]KAI3403136.2 hypothetical protein KGF56_004025 [Candida oxycetoniae]